MLQAMPHVPSKIQLLDQLLQSLAAVIVDIIAPATSNFNLPDIEPFFFTHQSGTTIWYMAPTFTHYYHRSSPSPNRSIQIITHASLITDPDVAGQNSRANYVVKQRTQFRSPILGSEMAPTDWTLHFPLPSPRRS